MAKTLYPANENNPYDSVGVTHNAEVEKIIEEIYGKELSVEEINEIVITYLVDDEVLPSDYVDDFISFDNIANIVDDDSDYCQETIGNLETSDEVKEFLYTLFHDISELAEENVEEYDTYYELICSLEEAIVSSIALSDSDKLILLITSSVARYSLFFWMSNAENYPRSNPNTKGLSLGQWIRVGLKDVAGAATGALTGAVAGTAIPGIGTATGAIVGGAAGAVSSSVDEYDKQVKKTE
ncbi:MAG: hypothetical protein LBO06_06760 [Bacteroidales bacterium]|jgi:hypothetical protein|nr:hypothetical protein [Bacteroidales bacterium]